MMSGVRKGWCCTLVALMYWCSPIGAEVREIPLNQGISFFWQLDYPARSLDIEVHADITTKGPYWIAVGFSDYGEIKPSDLCFLWINYKGKTFFHDTWVDKDGIVSIDKKQDCQNFQVLRNIKTIKFSFRRKFDTCDNEDYVLQDGTTHIVWARGQGPLWSLDGININTANSTGFERTTLLANDQPKPKHPRNTKSIEIRGNETAVPNEETTYWCSVIELPKILNTKHHIIETEPILDNQRLHLVHHMEVFHCPVPVNEKIPYYNGPCSSLARPERTKICNKVLAAWAMGAPPFSYPVEAGLPIGGPNFNRYVVLEVHFNNPTMKTGVTDSSGFKLYLTSKLRKYDAGVMELGLEYNDRMAIPPGQESFFLAGYCADACTAVGLPQSGITVFGSQLHTHLTGVRVFTKHVRQGVELPELNRDNHYSQHFQEIRRLKKPVKILPGDALITACEYKTTNKLGVTLTGFSISEEMCVNYIHYYPQTSLEVCKSSIPTGELEDYFDQMFQYEGQNTSSNKGISDNYRAIEWTPSRVAHLQRLYLTTPISMQCNQSSGARFPGWWEGLPNTKIKLPLPPPKRKCAAKYYF